jgi:hypothetical protein
MQMALIGLQQGMAAGWLAIPANLVIAGGDTKAVLLLL